MQMEPGCGEILEAGDMIHVEVGEDHVGHVVGADAFGGQLGHGRMLGRDLDAGHPRQDALGQAAAMLEHPGRVSGVVEDDAVVGMAKANHEGRKSQLPAGRTGQHQALVLVATAGGQELNVELDRGHGPLPIAS